MARLVRFSLVAVAISAFAGVAAAQAPITYAGGSGGPQASVQTASLGLSGGDENSYGYGRAERRRAGAVIDLRRPSSRRAPLAPEATVSAALDQESSGEAPAQSEQGAQPWLERERVGPPYQANGRWYVPTPEPGYEAEGTASWYGPQFHGQRTANGEVFDQEALTAAHPTLPLNSLVQVTNLANGREAIVRITDRGPFVGERLIDLSRRVAEVLGFEAQGHAQVHVRYLGPAPRRVAEGGASAPPPEQEGPASLLPPPPAVGAVEASRPSVAQAGFFVQVGAYSDLSNAHRVRETVGVAGPVQVDVRTTASGAELFRVRVGPLESREQAEAARQALSDLGYAETILASR